MDGAIGHSPAAPQIGLQAGFFHIGAVLTEKKDTYADCQASTCSPLHCRLTICHGACTRSRCLYQRTSYPLPPTSARKSKANNHHSAQSRPATSAPSRCLSLTSFGPHAEPGTMLLPCRSAMNSFLEAGDARDISHSGSSQLHIDHTATQRTLGQASGPFPTATRFELRKTRWPTKVLKNTTRKAAPSNSESARRPPR